MTPRTLAVPALALALAFAAAPVALADDTKAPEAEASSVKWIDGWDAGRTAAAESGKLMLVYVTRKSPP